MVVGAAGEVSCENKNSPQRAQRTQRRRREEENLCNLCPIILFPTNCYSLAKHNCAFDYLLIENDLPEKTEAFNNIEKALDAMKQKADTDEKARKLLESRIVGETKTVKTLYETARRFNDLEVENIYQGCLEILREYLNVEKSSLYIKEGGHLVLKASYGWKEGEGVEGRISLD